MKKQQRDGSRDDLIDAETLASLGEAIVPAAVDPERVNRLRSRIWRELGDGGQPEHGTLFDTIRGDEGHWIELAPGLSKKILRNDGARNLHSYLLKIEPGATVARHGHDADELCYVVEGDVSFGDLRLAAGDYHLAAAGSEHGVATSEAGALLFLQSGLPPEVSAIEGVSA